MSANETRVSTEEQSRELAEQSRETEWKSPSFLKEIFLGNFCLDLVHPYAVAEESTRPEFVEWFQKFATFLRDEVDPIEIDTTGEYPEHMVERCRELGAFGMKIPVEYGGLGFSNLEYIRVMQLLGGYCGNLTALLSAHQSIGVPQPIKVFGTEEQKKNFLPRCAAGAISAFALTEPNVGSDPASLATMAERTEDGDYLISGEKLWCTNGTFAELFVVMARHSDSGKISAFVVEGNSPGVEITHRCHFLGLRALGNAVVTFDKVRVPKGNLIGKEGAGLRIALTTLNTGRLSLPAGCVGANKRALETCREWANERNQWGRPIGRHEAIGQKLSTLAANTFAMEAIAEMSAEMADRGNYDIRLEAAAAKEWNSVRGWEAMDDLMQIRGGRGYETESSLAARGEKPIGVERAMRDSRINRIFEGSSEVMHLFIAREAVDTHLSVAGDIIDPKVSIGKKLAALPKIALFYARWYPPLWLRGLMPRRYAKFGTLGRHLRFVERTTRKLAREIFHGMMVHQAKMQHKQGFLFRAVDVGMDLFAMTVAVARAQRMRAEGHPQADTAVELSDMFCRITRDRVRQSFYGLWHNEDDASRKVSNAFLDGRYSWMEEGLVEVIDRPRPAPAVPVNGSSPVAEDGVSGISEPVTAAE